MYAELMGNYKMYRIKSRYGNKFVCEGRIVYDAFVLDNKKDAIYYSGTSAAAEPTRENHVPATDTQAYADLVDSLS